MTEKKYNVKKGFTDGFRDVTSAFFYNGKGVAKTNSQTENNKPYRIGYNLGQTIGLATDAVAFAVGGAVFESGVSAYKEICEETSNKRKVRKSIENKAQ